MQGEGGREGGREGRDHTNYAFQGLPDRPYQHEGGKVSKHGRGEGGKRRR